MAQDTTYSMTRLVRPTVILSLLLILQCSHRTCQSFQQSPLLLTTRSSVLSPSTSGSASTTTSESTGSFISNNRIYSSHTHFYADPSSTNVHDQTPPPPTFEQRMRQQLKRHQSNQRTSTTTTTTRTSAPSSSASSTTSYPTKVKAVNTKKSPKRVKVVNKLVPDIRDLKAFKEVLDKAGDDDKMLAVLWYSPWCRACKATMPGIRTLAKHHPNVRFIQVPVLAENASLHQGLDVPSVPFLHLYTPEDPRLVEEKKMTRKRLSGFQKLLCDYEKGHCSLEQMEGDDESGDKIWSTSEPYLVPSRSATIKRTPNTNFLETTTGGVGAIAP